LKGGIGKEERAEEKLKKVKTPVKEPKVRRLLLESTMSDERRKRERSQRQSMIAGGRKGNGA